MISIPLPTPSDLGECAFEDAIKLLGDVATASVVIVCSPDDAETAKAICNKYGHAPSPRILIVPHEILISDGTSWSWAVVSPIGSVYSKIA
jgi:hypothetical protein